MKFGDIEKILGVEAKGLLGHSCKTLHKSRLHLPGPDFVDRVWRDSDRSISVLRNLQTTLNHGRLGGTGYLSILPVDQGIEHSAGASFASIHWSSCHNLLKFCCFLCIALGSFTQP